MPAATSGLLMIRRLALFLAIGSSAAHAQTQLHILAGATFAELRGLGDVDLDRRTGLMGGLSLVIPLGSGTFALQPEALVTSKGAKAPADDGGLRLTYAEVPVLLRVNLVRSGVVQPHLYAGPYAGYRINCRLEGSDTASCDDTPEVTTRTVDVGGIVGGGLTFGLAGLRATVGARYGFGVSKFADFDFDDVRRSAKNGAYAVYVGLGFGGR
jgi:hypothetical protein